MPATAVDHEHGVTPRELFFDLVFVFAFTQVTTLLAHEATFTGLGRAVLVLGALWWPWTGYAWLTNTVDPEEGFVGASLLVALIAMFLAALAVPGAFGDDGVLFGASFFVVVAMHLALYALAARGDPGLFAAVLRLAPWTLLGAALILVAGFGFADGVRTWLWVAALLCTYVGAGMAGQAHAYGYRNAPMHPDLAGIDVDRVAIVDPNEALARSVAARFGFAGCSWPRRSSLRTSTSSRSAALECSPTCGAPTAWRSPAMCTRTCTCR